MTAENVLTIYATEALEEAFPALAGAFRAAGGAELSPVFGHTGALRLELEGNMACDVFLASDRKAPEALVQFGRAKKLFCYAHNAMVVVTREEWRFHRSDWSDILCDPSLAIGMSTPGNSPEGDWARALFAAVAKALPGKTGSNVIAQHAIPLIAGQHSGEELRGESGAHFMLRHSVDAAVCYASRAAKIRSEGLLVYPIPAEVCPEIPFCGCFPRTGKGDAAQAAAFADFLVSAAGREILGKAGFLPA